jgi:hypothetical protein
VLTQREQRIWDEIEHAYADQADAVATVVLEDRQGRAAQVEDVPFRLVAGVSAVVVGLWVTIVLVLTGAVLAATAVGVATIVAWLLLRRSPAPGGTGRTAP